MLSVRSSRAAALSAAAFFATHALAVAGPVISEIMYRPGTGWPEPEGQEYIEIYNPDAGAVDLSGWALTSGVSYTFPAGTTLAAGGYLVVGSSPAAVQGAFGVTGVLGPWVGSLSNNTEKVELSQPGVTAGTFVSVDAVTYASEGDWAVRYREGTWGGWDWRSPGNNPTDATVGGRSLEVRNVALSNDNGQNWAVCSAGSRGTPGGANSVQTPDIAPVIKAVKHSPAVPTSTQSVTISCELNDETPVAGLSATLFYRNATTASPPAFSSVAMIGDGRGQWSAVLPPMSDQSIREFYIQATDGTLTRTFPAATTEGQTANCQYQVDNAVPSLSDATYRLTLTKAENDAFNNASSGSDQVFNQTLIVQRGAQADIRYSGGMRTRGNSSRSYQFRPLRIGISNDDPLDGVTSFNLHPRAPHLQHLGMRLMQAAGVAASDTIPVELRRNGVEYTTSSGRSCATSSDGAASGSVTTNVSPGAVL